MPTETARKNIQILRGSSEYDPSTGTDTLLDGQQFYSKRTKQLFVGEDGNQIKDLKAINDPENILFTKDIETAYTIGGVQGTPTNRKKLFEKGETLATALDRIFNPSLQPSKTNPNISLTLSSYNGSGELGSNWPTITYTVNNTAGSYTYGPDTGVTWSNGNVTYSGNTSGKYGDGNRTYSVTGTYSDGVVALDNKGKESNPIVQITSSTDTDTKTFTETILYRQFYGNVEGSNIDDILTNLKDVTSNNGDNSLKTYLQNSNPGSIEVTLTENGYIYFITKDVINKATMGGFEFPITKMGNGTFTNSYGKSYNVNVYKSSLEQTPGTYPIALE